MNKTELQALIASSIQSGRKNTAANLLAVLNAVAGNTPERVTIEITPTNVYDLKNGNGGYGIMAIPQVVGSYIEIVGTPVIYNNGVPINADTGILPAIQMEIKYGYGTTVCSVADSPIQGSGINEKECIEFKRGDVVYRYVGFEDSGSETIPGSVFIYANVPDGWTTNAGGKVWVEIDYLLRVKPE